MHPQSLGYVGIRAKNTEDWSGYGSKLLGLQQVDKSRSSLAFRMDDRKQRIVIDADGGEGIKFFGWEVADAAALDSFAGHLDGKGIRVARGCAAPADERRVKDLRHAQRSGRQPGRDLLWRRGRGRGIQAGPQHFGLPHRGARPSAMSCCTSSVSRT